MLCRTNVNDGRTRCARRGETRRQLRLGHRVLPHVATAADVEHAEPGPAILPAATVGIAGQDGEEQGHHARRGDS